MHRKTALLILAMTLIFLSMGMSGLGLSGDDKFPKPRLDFHVEITDTTGVVHAATNASFNGKTALSGFHGKASLSVDFRRIKRLSVTPTDSKTWVMAHLYLRNGDEVDLKVKGLARCYGITNLGEMSVRMRDVSQVVFDDELPDPPEDKKSKP